MVSKGCWDCTRLWSVAVRKKPMTIRAQKKPTSCRGVRPSHLAVEVAVEATCVCQQRTVQSRRRRRRLHRLHLLILASNHGRATVNEADLGRTRAGAEEETSRAVSFEAMVIAVDTDRRRTKDRLELEMRSAARSPSSLARSSHQRGQRGHRGSSSPREGWASSRGQNCSIATRARVNACASRDRTSCR